MQPRRRSPRRARCRAPRTSAPRSAASPQGPGAWPSARTRISAPAASVGSSACSISGRPSGPMRSRPSAPARAEGIATAVIGEPHGAGRSQLSEIGQRLAAAAARCSGHDPNPRELRLAAAGPTHATRAGSSSGGSVFGIAQTVVKPPCAAALVPVAIVSAPSPRARAGGCAGRTEPAPRPARGRRSARMPSGASSPAPTSRPSTTARSRSHRSPLAGSMTRAPASTNVAGASVSAPKRAVITAAARKACQHGHAHRDAVVTCRPIRLRDRSPPSSAVSSTPSLVGPGCRTGAPGRARSSAPRRRPSSRVYARSDAMPPPASRSSWTRRVMTASASRSASWRLAATRTPGQRIEAGDQGRRPAKPTTRAPSGSSACRFERATRECTTSPTIATVRLQRAAQRLAQRERVEQRLGRMGMRPVTGVDDAQPVARAARYGAPHAECRRTTVVTPVRSQRAAACRPATRPCATLLPAIGRSTTVAPSALRRQLEAHPRSRRRLVERQVATVSRSSRLAPPPLRPHRAHLDGQPRPDAPRASPRHPLDVEEVPEVPVASSPRLPRDDDLVVARHRSRTGGRARSRRARSGRFLPTWSGRIGSSRWPRSTTTARRTAVGRPWSVIASSAARTVRPVNSTSSTSTTVLADLRHGVAALDDRRVGHPGQVVAIEGDVERPDRDRPPRAPRSAPPAAVRAGRRGCGCRPGRGRRCRRCARRSRARCASAPGAGHRRRGCGARSWRRRRHRPCATDGAATPG